MHRRRLRRSVALAFGLCLVGADAAARAQPNAAQAAADAEVSPLIVDVHGLDADEMRDALGLRLPQRPIELWGRGPAIEGSSYASIHYTAPTLRITLIQPNGDAYDRTLPTVEEQPLRTAAVELTTLLDAVGSGGLRPDRTDVPLPEPEPETEPQPEPQPEPEPETQPEPEPQTEPEPQAEPRPETARISIGLSAAPMVALGLAPTRGPVFMGEGVSIDLLLATRAEVLFGLETRVLGQSVAGYRVIRARFGAIAGYRYRRGAFELVTLGRLFVEPWWLRHDGGGVALLHDVDEAVNRQPLFGAGVRVSPGVRLGAQKRIRLGAVVDVDGSLVPDEGGRSVVLSDQTANGTRPFARLGGAELGLGLDFTFWF